MKVIDSSVLVEIDRGSDPEKVKRLDSESRHLISTVSVTEMFLGVEKLYSGEELDRKKQHMNDFLSRFRIKKVDWPIATESAAIIEDLKQKGEPLHDLHDIYIAATATNQNLPVLTCNPEHFHRIDNLEVSEWKNY